MAEDAHTLHAEVLTPEGEVFSGELRQLSTRTKVGEIGILANHVPVLARLVPTELRLHVDEGETKRYAQAEGWLQVFANRALVLVGEAVEPEALDYYVDLVDGLARTEVGLVDGAKERSVTLIDMAAGEAVFGQVLLLLRRMAHEHLHASGIRPQ